ncbi:hypothetical protein GCM10020000_27580 [Streptomyces olivoverticillatus]
MVARSSATSAETARGGAGGPLRYAGRLDAEFGQEAGGLVAVFCRCLDGGDDQACAGARGRHVEQAAFLGEEGAGAEGFGDPVAADAVGFQEGAAAAQVGPEALLDARDDHEVPLQALGAVGGHQPYGVGAHGAAGEGVGGDVLGVQLVQEVEGAAAAGAFFRAGGGFEEGAHGVQVAVGVAARGAAAVRCPLEAGGPGGAVPERPEGVFGGAAGGEEFAGGAQESAQVLGVACVRRVVCDQALGLGEGFGDEFVRGPRHGVACGPLFVSEGAAQFAEVCGVHAAEGGGEEGERRLGGEPGPRGGQRPPAHP